MTTKTNKTNKQTATDDYGNTISFYALQDEPVWNKGFEFYPYRVGTTEFARSSNTYGQRRLIRI